MADYFDVLFSKDNPFVPKLVSGGTTNGRVKRQDVPVAEKHLPDGERVMYEEDIDIMRQQLRHGLTLLGTQKFDDAPADRPVDEVYKKYNFDHYTQTATQLPVHAFKSKILSKIAEYPSVVIEGSTGCGKSTQIPQMILDDAKEKGHPCNIVVTQPRRIAARSIAEQVCRERGWTLGQLVGYQIGLDKRFVSEDTRILYCTTGVLLERLVQSKDLAHFTHIILDEVHERDKDMDFLFIIIRMLMAKGGTNIRIVLMSATIDTEKFAEYFSFFRHSEFKPAPIVRIDRKGAFKVSEFYLDHFDLKALPEVSLRSPGISAEMFKLTLSLIKNIDKEQKADPSAAILVFLPGIFEIGSLHTILHDYSETYTDGRWKIFILHSLISSEDQQSIFKHFDDRRKIILSTNIAESSITVPDVKYVIDFCLTKYLKSDSSKNCTRLEMEWAAKSNCRQRLGRAGRVSNGRCYRMVPKRFFEFHMADTPVPELLLTPLENVVLKAKTFDMAAPHELLGLAMDRPRMEDVANTMLTLKELGALRLGVGEDVEYSAIDGDLTFLGRIMANLPIDIRCTRLIAIGFCYGVLSDCIVMAAGLTSKSIFRISFEKTLHEYSHRLEWSNGSGSDLFAILNAYKVWTMQYNQREFGANREEQLRAEREFCRKHSLDMRSMNECHQLVLELTQRLDKLGIREQQGVNRVRWTEQEKVIILKWVIGGAFYPNFFATLPITNPMVERDIFRTMNGRDPDNTVFFTGFRTENIRQLYADSIQNLFRNTVVDEDDIGCVKVSFDSDSEKVFVTFDIDGSYNDGERSDWQTKRCSIPGKTLTEVYKAIKMRQMRMSTHIVVLKSETEKYVAEKFGIGIMTGSTFTLKEHLRDDINNMCLPSLGKKLVDGIVTHVENCSRFWFQPNEERQTVAAYVRQLNQPDQDIFEPCTEEDLPLNRTTIYVARNHRDQKFYRARITSYDFNTQTMTFKGTVCFIDTGLTQKCEPADIFKFTKAAADAVDQAMMPARCFPCRLAEIQPSTANISGGYLWDRAAIDLFNEYTTGAVKAEIYSMVNGTAHVFIWSRNVNVNDQLIQAGLGEPCEENFLSKNNRWKRQNKENFMEMAEIDEYYPVEYVEPLKALQGQVCDRSVQLLGPRSPLESEMYSVLMHHSKSAIKVDTHSVNSVILTPLQQDLSIKYMVASHISTRSKVEEECTVHETTLLPSIRGFGPLMAMAFCPTMDLKRDQHHSRYISVRTGLGYNEDNNSAYYADHDTVFALDFEFTKNDLELINQIRYSFDTLLFASSNNQQCEVVQHKNQFAIMTKLKESTLELLTKERPAMEINTMKHDWHEYYPEDMQFFDNIYGRKAIFPMHGLLKLKGRSREVEKSLWTHCTALHNMTRILPRPVTCELCNTVIENVAVLRTHLMSRLHLEREKQIGFSLNDLDGACSQAP